ncbi:LPS translocon maturation chaperone LptM [Catenovulum sp. SX2]|uniref:LPS translocon maturation chaperone LptM n=1 Tax=Catenovulum TaxID=1172191 RepID=UPI00030AE680|nr:lipoprotein [Catenovulum agarivorans]
MRFKTLSALISCSLLICACGQRGPLTMPKPTEQNTQTQAHNNTVQQNTLEQTTNQ